MFSVFISNTTNNYPKILIVFYTNKSFVHKKNEDIGSPAIIRGRIPIDTVQHGLNKDIASNARFRVQASPPTPENGQ